MCRACNGRCCDLDQSNQCGCDQCYAAACWTDWVNPEDEDGMEEAPSDSMLLCSSEKLYRTT